MMPFSGTKHSNVTAHSRHRAQSLDEPSKAVPALSAYKAGAANCLGVFFAAARSSNQSINAAAALCLSVLSTWATPLAPSCGLNGYRLPTCTRSQGCCGQGSLRVFGGGD